VSERSPDQHYETSLSLEDAIYFASSLLTVGKILEPELAEDGVESTSTQIQNFFTFSRGHFKSISRMRERADGLTPAAAMP
jgi:hypothetical protein